jgi:hypothetical protein
MPRISKAMTAKVMIVRRSLPGVIAPSCAFAEMDVADVDEVPVLLVAGVEARRRILVGDVALLPGRQLRVDRGFGSVPGFSFT